MKRFFCFICCSISATDLFMTLVQNIKEVLILKAAPRLGISLFMSPELTFGWLQVLVNGAVTLLVLFGLWQFFQLVCAYDKKQHIVWNMRIVLGIGIVAVLGVPSLWKWVNAILPILQGLQQLQSDHPRYFLVSLNQSIIGFFLLYTLCRLFMYRFTQKGID